MAIKRIEPRVLLPQSYEHRPTSSVVLYRNSEPHLDPLTLSLDLGNADAYLGLTEASARRLRDLLDAGLASLDTPFDPVEESAIGDHA